MLRQILGAVSCALALAMASAPAKADGAINSLSDLNGGAQDWHAIAPGGSADKKPTNPLPTTAATPAATPVAATKRVTRLDDNLSIDTPPPPPPKPVPSLWFTQQPGKQGK